MRNRFTIETWLTCFLCFLASCARNPLTAKETNTAMPSAKRSPFEPLNSVPKTTAKATTPALVEVTNLPPVKVELRGYMQWKGDWYFSIHDLDNRETYWITKKQGAGGFEYQDWGEFTNKLKLSYQGREITLQLKKPDYKVSKRPVPITPPRKTRPIPSPGKRPTG
jgi:hypothetical protein